MLDREISPFDVPERPKPLNEPAPQVLPFGISQRNVTENAYPKDLPRLLRLSGKRRGEDGSKASDERAAVHHSII
jgi:hypothetical protein